MGLAVLATIVLFIGDFGSTSVEAGELIPVRRIISLAEVTVPLNNSGVSIYVVAWLIPIGLSCGYIGRRCIAAVLLVVQWV